MQRSPSWHMWTSCNIHAWFDNHCLSHFRGVFQCPSVSCFTCKASIYCMIHRILKFYILPCTLPFDLKLYNFKLGFTFLLLSSRRNFTIVSWWVHYRECKFGGCRITQISQELMLAPNEERHDLQVPQFSSVRHSGIGNTVIAKYGLIILESFSGYLQTPSCHFN